MPSTGVVSTSNLDALRDPPHTICVSLPALSEGLQTRTGLLEVKLDGKGDGFE